MPPRMGMHPGMQMPPRGMSMPGYQGPRMGMGMPRGMAMNMHARPPPRGGNGLCGELMNPRDVQYVISQQLRQLHTAGSDPLSDDYYYQHWLRRQRAKAMSSGHATPSAPLPLPVWKRESSGGDSAQKILQHEREKTQAQASQKWEKKHNVLGHCAKSHVSRPKQLLSIPKADPGAGDGGDEDANADDGDNSNPEGKWSELGSPRHAQSTGAAIVPFKNSLWYTRLAVEKLARTTLALQDVLRLLEVQSHQPVAGEMHQQRIKLQRQLISGLGLKVVHAVGQGSGTEVAESNELHPQQHKIQSVDHVKLSAVLQLPKGARLVAQILLQLPAMVQHALIIDLVVHILSQEPLPVEAPPEAAVQPPAVQLSNVLLVCLKSPNPAAKLPLALLAGCLNGALAKQTNESLGKILHNKSCAQVLQAVLEVGTTASTAAKENDVSKTVSDEWAAARAKFVEMATAAAK